MRVEVVMPKMGESLQEGTVTKWMKKVGEKVERDEMILEISTDKVDTEVPSPNEGVLAEILVEEGETVEVGTAIAIIETDASESAESKTETPKEEPKAPSESKENPKAATEPKQEKEAPKASVKGGKITEVVMPKMGESLQEGTVTKWLVKVGENVERDQMILEISTDKVDTEVPSPVDGILAEIMVQEGETVEVGVPIAKISSGGTVGEKSAPVSTAGESQEVKAETNNESKAETKSAPQASITVPAGGGTKEIPPRDGENFYSPLVRKIAQDNGVTLEELRQIKGSGVEGRINKNDILDYIENRSSAPAPKAAPSAPAAAAPKATSTVPATPSAPQISLPTGDDVEVIPMNRIRQLISDHMVYSKHTSAHVTSVAEVDVTGIVNFRNKFKQEFENREGFKLTYTPFFAQAVIDAIRQFPMVNISVDGKNILRHKRINLGIATALPDGNLIVPVIKGSDMLNITGVARSIYDLANRARNKKLSPDEIQGGTVTLTNVGTFGTLFGTPIINQPQCAIFGVGAIKKRPMVKEIEGNDLILVRQMMYASITYDHRVIDGMLAGQTLAAVVKNLESMNEKTIVI
ncbi:MAG: 2-oxoglutarate dehydrogenase, E2 component, dihydrolipoamide succinyltransferase [Desulfobulbaceae bacterium]|nr:2-oxoglutarate dehydrogenase, E2 component, dihydrolipoamide succinyltransferase [Desulfobulbaceae bacterium]